MVLASGLYKAGLNGCFSGSGFSDFQASRLGRLGRKKAGIRGLMLIRKPWPYNPMLSASILRTLIKTRGFLNQDPTLD